MDSICSVVCSEQLNGCEWVTNRQQTIRESRKNRAVNVVVCDE